jgi:hypothetical protein
MKYLLKHGKTLAFHQRITESWSFSSVSFLSYMSSVSCFSPLSQWWGFEQSILSEHQKILTSFNEISNWMLRATEFLDFVHCAEFQILKFYYLEFQTMGNIADYVIHHRQNPLEFALLKHKHNTSSIYIWGPNSNECEEIYLYTLG